MTLKIDLSSLISPEDIARARKATAAAKDKKKLPGEKKEFKPMRSGPPVREPKRVGPDSILSEEHQSIFHHLEVDLKSAQKEAVKLKAELRALKKAISEATDLSDLKDLIN